MQGSSGGKWLEGAGWDEGQVLEQPNPEDNIEGGVAKRRHYFSCRCDAAGVAKNRLYFHVVSGTASSLFLTRMPRECNAVGR